MLNKRIEKNLNGNTLKLCLYKSHNKNKPYSPAHRRYLSFAEILELYKKYDLDSNNEILGKMFLSAFKVKELEEKKTTSLLNRLIRNKTSLVNYIEQLENQIMIKGIKL